MAPLSKLTHDFTQKIVADSTSWGSLAILIFGLGLVLMMMVVFSYRYG
ncbi:hypothetical protein [Aliterella atlantica]|nr:hypothetical protein [Aliterella atlantica]